MKRTLVVATGLIAVMAAGQKAQAKDLEDVLKEKGVISEADLKEVTKKKPYDYKPGKGFIFTSPDEKFQLNLGGQIQVQYEYDNYDDPANGRCQPVQSPPCQDTIERLCLLKGSDIQRQLQLDQACAPARTRLLRQRT